MQRVPEQKPRSIEVPDSAVALPMPRDVSSRGTITHGDVFLCSGHGSRDLSRLPFRIDLDFHFETLPRTGRPFLVSRPFATTEIVANGNPWNGRAQEFQGRIHGRGALTNRDGPTGASREPSNNKVQRESWPAGATRRRIKSAGLAEPRPFVGPRRVASRRLTPFFQHERKFPRSSGQAYPLTHN